MSSFYYVSTFVPYLYVCWLSLSCDLKDVRQGMPRGCKKCSGHIDANTLIERIPSSPSIFLYQTFLTISY